MIKLLYVEDEPNLAKIVSETLRQRQMHVKQVSNGAEALKVFQSFVPDICILDVMLPHVDGYTISRQIRAIDHKVPILFLTAKSLAEDALDGFNAGGNDYIRKPFSMEELIARIKNLLRLTNKNISLDPSSEQFIIGKFTFYPARQELVIENHVRRLSHRETELLQMLIERKHDTVQRKTILDKIWGNDSVFNSRNLDVYITKLRDYFKQDEKVQIITLKAVGYRMVD